MTVSLGSKLYTPKSDPNEWLIAKAMAELADHDVCQASYHLSHVHFRFSVFCLIYHRHFSRQHPLYDVMKYHCEGTTPHASLTLAYSTYCLRLEMKDIQNLHWMRVQNGIMECWLMITC